MNGADVDKNHLSDFLEFLRSKFPLFHQSNIFYRDIRYGMKYYLGRKGKRLSDAELGKAVNTLINRMVTDGILKPVSAGAWALEYAEFRTKTSGKPVL